MPVTRKRLAANNAQSKSTEAKPKVSRPQQDKLPSKGKKPSEDSLDSLTSDKTSMENAPGVSVHEFNVASSKRTIVCNLRPANPPTKSHTIIFTHGAGGDNSTAAVANFAEGFAMECSKPNTQSDDISGHDTRSIICFQGPMHLKTRTTMFHDVMEHCATSENYKNGSDGVLALGGRSMGARAAVLAATDAKQVQKLVLVSYPLQSGNGELRDQILLEIDGHIEVLFVSGDKDNMCDLKQLEDVRKKMKAKSWLLTVEGADHGMNCRQKKRTKEMQVVTGQLAAEWVAGDSIKNSEGNVGRMEGCNMGMSLPLESGNSNNDSGSEATTVSTAKRRRETTAKESKETNASKKRKTGKRY